jgi:hypothetical protein
VFALGGDTVGIVKRGTNTAITKDRCSFEGQPLTAPDNQAQANVVEYQFAWVFLPVDGDSTALATGDAIRYPMPSGLDYAVSVPAVVETDIRGRANHVFVVAGAKAGAESIDALLAAWGVAVTLTPATGVVTDKPGGGKDYAPAAPRATQLFATFNTGSFDGREHSPADQGMARKLAIRLVGRADAQIEIGDTFSDDIAAYKVASVDRATPYKVDALAVAFLDVGAHGVG